MKTLKRFDGISVQRPMVFIVDGDASMRQRLRDLVASNGFQPVGFAFATEYLLARPPDVPACLVADLNLPDMTGLELQQRIAATHTPIVFCARKADVPTAVRAMKAGAVDVLAALASDEDLLHAVCIAVEKDRVRRFDRDRRAVLERRFSSMTPRECVVLQFVVSGLLNKQVAMKLGISEITVKTHRGRLMRKMAARSFADLVRMAAELELPRAEPAKAW